MAHMITALASISPALWGVIASVFTALVTAALTWWATSTNSKSVGRKTAIDEFTAINKALHDEISRVSDRCKELSTEVSQSKEDNNKCERRYFELALQHKELIIAFQELKIQLNTLKNRPIYDPRINDQTDDLK